MIIVLVGKELKGVTITVPRMRSELDTPEGYVASND